jgi:hypothetical protein
MALYAVRDPVGRLENVEGLAAPWIKIHLAALTGVEDVLAPVAHGSITGRAIFSPRCKARSNKFSAN